MTSVTSLAAFATAALGSSTNPACACCHARANRSRFSGDNGNRLNFSTRFSRSWRVFSARPRSPSAAASRSYSGPNLECNLSVCFFCRYIQTAAAIAATTTNAAATRMSVVLSMFTDPPLQPECANRHSTAVQFWTTAGINPRREEVGQAWALDMSYFDVGLWDDTPALLKPVSARRVFCHSPLSLLVAACALGSS